ncbi:hypothetical protein EJB05_57306 [Eragrostis curvula]|uniref:Uncharacterized protein n=1 Tax=Eragrostis curvula TaxID=38414 RepID=A0A5J9SEC2_9POAL|nr:hypothetical protein EJB05_57306 [Eragrostis curvula]
MGVEKEIRRRYLHPYQIRAGHHCFNRFEELDYRMFQVFWSGTLCVKIATWPAGSCMNYEAISIDFQDVELNMRDTSFDFLHARTRANQT